MKRGTTALPGHLNEAGPLMMVRSDDEVTRQVDAFKKRTGVNKKKRVEPYKGISLDWKQRSK